jgi:hypothetical protein
MSLELQRFWQQILTREGQGCHNLISIIFRYLTISCKQTAHLPRDLQLRLVYLRLKIICFFTLYNFK